MGLSRCWVPVRRGLRRGSAYVHSPVLKLNAKGLQVLVGQPRGGAPPIPTIPNPLQLGDKLINVVSYDFNNYTPVSYTHLTLPTILRV